MRRIGTTQNTHQMVHSPQLCVDLESDVREILILLFRIVQRFLQLHMYRVDPKFHVTDALH